MIGGLRRLLARLRRPRPTVPPPAALAPTPPVAFRCGALRVTVMLTGSRAPLGRAPRAVYEVTIASGSAERWTARYGFPLEQAHSSHLAAEAALDDLERLNRDPQGWREELVAGMTDRETVALLESPAAAGAEVAAAWAGPLLRRDGAGWPLIPEDSPA